MLHRGLGVGPGSGGGGRDGSRRRVRGRRPGCRERPRGGRFPRTAGRPVLVRRLRLVHRDAEGGGQADQAGGIALADRTELPALAAAVQLAADDRRLFPGLRPHIEHRQRLAVGERGVEQEYPQVRDLLEGGPVGGGRDDDLVHRGVERPEIRLDRVRQPFRDTALRQPPDQAGGVSGLVVEDEVLVRPHPPGRTEEQSGGVHVGNPGARGPAQHGPDGRGIDRDVRALQHRVRHDGHPACWGPVRTTRGAALPSPAAVRTERDGTASGGRTRGG